MFIIVRVFFTVKNNRTSVRRLLIIRARFHRAPQQATQKSEHRTSRMQILYMDGGHDFVITRERTVAPYNFLIQSANDSTEYLYTPVRSFIPDRWVNNSSQRPVKTLFRRRFVKKKKRKKTCYYETHRQLDVNLYFLIGSPRIRFAARIIAARYDNIHNLRADIGNNL